MFPFLEFKNFAFSQKKFLVFWGLRVFLVFATFSYALQELEEFSRQNYSYNRSLIIYLFAILQFVLIFVCIYFFRKELDEKKEVTLEEYFLFLLRWLLAFLIAVASIIGVVFGIVYFLKASGAQSQEPSIYVKFAEVSVIVILFPILILYSSIAVSRFRALPSWSDFKAAAHDGVYRWFSLILFFISLFIFIFPFLITGLPTPEDLQTQYKYAKVRLCIEILPFLFAEILHLALIFFFVRKFGGLEPEEEE